MDDRMVRVLNIVLDSLLPLIKAGVLFTVPLAVLSFILGLLLAFGVAVIRVTRFKPLEGLVKFYVWLIRGTPLLIQLFIIFYGLPSIGLTLNAFTSALIGFTLSVGAYSSETLRGAILSIPKGQWEAAKALGMSSTQTLWHIILPQALSVALPALGNAFISLVKDTSLAAAITYTELFQVAQQITARTYEPLVLYVEAGVVYLFFSSGLSWLQGHLEQKFSKGRLSL